MKDNNNIADLVKLIAEGGYFEHCHIAAGLLIHKAVKVIDSPPVSKQHKPRITIVFRHKTNAYNQRPVPFFKYGNSFWGLDVDDIFNQLKKTIALMARLKIKRQDRLEPLRMQRALDKLAELGLTVHDKSETLIAFYYKGNLLYYWPYSGWGQGKGIKPGRGFDFFFNQLNSK